MGDRENRVAKTGTALPVLKRFAKGGSLEAGIALGAGGEGGALLSRRARELCGDFDTRYRCVLIGNNMPRCLGVVGCGGT